MTMLANLCRKFLFILPRAILVGIFLFTLVVTVLSNFDYFEPYLPPVYLSRAKVRPLTDRILIGPYPHRDEMFLLKKQGIEVIVSFLDNSLPQEMALFEREKINAAKVGIELRHFPLGYLPVNSEKNRRVRAEFLKFAADGKKKLYLHCYLGRHRVQFAADALTAGENRHGQHR